MLSFPCLLKSALPSTKFGWSSYHPTSDNGRHGSILKRRIKRIGRIQGINPKYVPDVSPPWALTFDLRERETLWTDQNQVLLHFLSKIKTLLDFRLDWFSSLPAIDWESVEKSYRNVLLSSRFCCQIWARTPLQITI